uniref:Replication restart DNA helicase PriA n=1 Tax=Oscillatoriales cyanobacterium SpSt-402 TaxID=2282168 RepID=A0A832M3Z8_9CYAN
MNTVTKIDIHCPNCGGSAERHTLAKEQLVRTQCAHCDYLMITCSKTGNVIEAYAPGYSVPIRTL